MATLHLLGTGAAFTDPYRTTTMLAVQDESSSLLIDCGGDVVQRAQAAGIPLETIDGLVVTHEHPDHVSGYPLFIEKIWLAGRRRPIDVYGIAPAIGQAQRTFATFETSGWGLPEIRYHQVAGTQGSPVLRSDAWEISSAPGTHGVPVIGLRIRSVRDGGTMVYSCDTERSEAITDLARGADLLVHEANGPLPGHSSIADAVDVAEQAKVERLVLVHLPPGCEDAELDPFRSRVTDLRFGHELESVSF